jgi:tetratricopeptide (TPR) repeat protein
MDEALGNMQRVRKEDYDSMIPLFLFNPNRDSSVLAPDMDSIIQKASLGIQIHDPRTKWADDLYLLLGQAYYYKGNYNDATAAFRYIISINQQRKMKAQRKAARNHKKFEKDISVVEKEDKTFWSFLKHKPANNDAVLWMARTYTQSGKAHEAESILDLLDNDKNLSEKYKGRVALEKAFLNLGKNDYKTAADNLAIVAADNHSPKWIRMRAAFLNGQILAMQGNFQEAVTSYQQVIALNPKIEMDFYARKHLAYCQLQQGNENEAAIASLKSLLKDGKYSTYYEQVYYVLGRLSANNNQFDDAIAYLRKSLSSLKSTKKQKALSFASLGNIYYTKGDYQNAKLSYDSASYLAKYAAGDSMVAVAMKRAGVLDKVAFPTQVIHDEDSLLALATLSEKEQKNRVRQYIHQLEKARADSIALAENGGGPSNITDAEDLGNASTAWYFSNSVLMQQGFNDFKRKWGNRPNVDNWNRGAKLNSSAAQNNTDDGGQPLKGFDENGIPTELSLLAMIPSSEAQQKEAKDKLQRAYLDLSDAYINDLNDYARATQTLDTFDKRFPNTTLKAEALYLHYQLALKKNELNLAQSYTEQLRQNYADTKWAKLTGPAATDTKATDTLSEILAMSYYETTYEMMMQRDYTNLLQRTREGQKLYKEPVFKNRFRIMETIALVGTGDYVRADSLIKDFIAKHPKDSLKTWALTIAKFISQNKPKPQPADTTVKNASEKGVPVTILTNPKGTVQAAKDDEAANATVAQKPNNNQTVAPPSYTYNPKQAHIYLFYFHKMESKTMGVKVGLNDFNTFNYSKQHLKTDVEMFKPDQGIIAVKTFPNAAAAKIYMNVVNANKLILKEYKNSEYQTLIISEDNFSKLNTDKNILPYLDFYKKHYK